MTRQHPRITDVVITPVAFRDPPLLNNVGVHEPYALRAILQVHTDEGIIGLGETYADEAHLQRLRVAAQALIGASVLQTSRNRQLVAAVLQTMAPLSGGDGVAGQITTASTVDRVYSPFEVACLDIIGKWQDLSVVDLLGGRVRDEVPFSGYLFYKWANHPDDSDSLDTWGEALDPEGLVSQARRMIDDYGFTALKLKGGVFPPDEEIAAIRTLAAAFPGVPLRLDPNAAWTVETSLHVARELEGIVEYLEDPTPGIDGMAQVAAATPIPLATNMAVVSFADLEPAVRAQAVSVVLSDHHFWGGLRQSQLLGGICENFGMGLSMHSNSHLGISLAAMVHLAGATENLNYACDTHWPWKHEEIIKPGVLGFENGSVVVPTGPGLGVEIDEGQLAALHENYQRSGQLSRDDTGYMRRYQPDFQRKFAAW